MGRKAKIGKRRRDKFYHLAKETGYRARSAFKLIQLNRKYHFLQQCRVLVDLCAAPGGWLQVAAKFMPVSSLIIGIDLVPIKSIPSVITLQEDITTDRCRQQLKRELKTWKVDCMLNDGAPNVGSAWVQDAFSQAELTLSALKLACTFLKQGGWFITKVFRSKDYQPLMCVLQQLFKNVHSTKPQASRSESAEIFVVCQGYLAPAKVDPKLLDPRHVFAELDEGEQPEQKISLTRLQKPPKSARGYPDDARILFKAISVADFITGDDYLTILSTVNRLEFDRTSEVFSKHPLTSDEIRQSCEDLKVLGPRELKQLVKWREKMRKFLDDAGSDGDSDAGDCVSGDKVGDESDEDRLLDRIDEKIKSLEKSEAAEVKRELKHLRRQRRKLKERAATKGDANREASELTRQEELFRLGHIKSRGQLEEVERGEMETVEDYMDDGEEEGSECRSESEEVEDSELENMESDTEDEDKGESDDESDDESDLDSEEKGENDNEESSADKEGETDVDLTSDDPGNPLLVSLESSAMVANARSRKAKLWFSKSAFEGLDNEEDDDIELEQMMSANKGQNVKKAAVSGDGEENRSIMATNNNTRENGVKSVQFQDNGDLVRSQGSSSEEGTTSSDDSDSDDSNKEEELLIAKAKAAAKKSVNSSSSGNEVVENGTFEVVPANKPIQKLNPEGLAIGALMVQSKKKCEDLIESGYNRWTYNDDNLPDWFVADEAKNCQKTLPITKEMVEVYRSKLKEINSRPIKKIAEAKARKKRRALKKLERVRERAGIIADLGDDVSVQEKAQQIKQMYKKVGVLGKRKREVEYVVAKRGVGKRVKRPAGVKGHFKVVDPRMKKDARGKAAAAKIKGQRSGGQRKRRKR